MSVDRGVMSEESGERWKDGNARNEEREAESAEYGMRRKLGSRRAE